MRTLVAVVLGIGALLGGDAKAPSGLAGTVDAPAKGAAAVKQVPNAPQQEAAALRAQIAQLMLVTLRGLYGPNTDESSTRARTPFG